MCPSLLRSWMGEKHDKHVHCSPLGVNIDTWCCQLRTAAMELSNHLGS